MQQHVRQIGIDDDWKLPLPTTSIPTQEAPSIPAAPSPEASHHTSHGAKRRKESSDETPFAGSVEDMMDYQDATSDVSDLNIAPGFRGPDRVSGPSGLGSFLGMPVPPMHDGPPRLGSFLGTAVPPTNDGPFHQAPAQSPREEDLQRPLPGLPGGATIHIPAGLPPNLHHSMPRDGFSAVIEPPRRPVGGQSIWFDDNSTFATQPSLAASSVSAPSLMPLPEPATSAPLPTKVHKVARSNPKADIHAYYGKQKTANKTISAANYYTWHDGGQAHQLRWTSVFCCPSHGVLYHSIPFHGSPDEPPALVNGSYWFTKKTTAEHAAAAHALDYQTGLNNLAAVDVLPDPKWEVPATATPDVKAKVEAQQNHFRVANGKQPLVRR